MDNFESLRTVNGEEIVGPILIQPKVFEDERGFFYESWNKTNFNKITNKSNIDFVQDNHSKSSLGVLRGLHYQLSPSEQGKLIRCTSGIIYDVAVDMRKSSSTFGKWVGTEISSENKQQFWIPEGFAHGFLTLSNFAEVQYKTTNYWDPNLERSIKWNDTNLNILWPTKNIGEENIKINLKDSNAFSFEEALSNGDIF